MVRIHDPQPEGALPKGRQPHAGVGTRTRENHPGHDQVPDVFFRRSRPSGKQVGAAQPYPLAATGSTRGRATSQAEAWVVP